jgi:hypothetical protein
MAARDAKFFKCVNSSHFISQNIVGYLIRFLVLSFVLMADDRWLIMIPAAKN